MWPSAVFVTLFLINVIEGARILGIFPTPSFSHQIAFRPLTLELAKRGHELTVLTTDPVYPKGQSPANFTEIDVHDMSYREWNAFLRLSKGNPDDLAEQTRSIMKIVQILFTKEMRTAEFQEVLKSGKKFDLILIEAMIRPARVLTHIFNAPAILISSFGSFGDIYDITGMPTHPILYPALLRQRLENLTFWEKIYELYQHYNYERLWHEVSAEEEKTAVDSFGPNLPKITEVGENIALVLFTVHPFWEHNRPVPPNVVFVGGLHQKPQKELPSDLQKFLDSSKNGVIYISFGTNVIPSLLPPERIQILVKAFSQLPYDVLWKWDKDELPGKPDNIKIAKWLPQSDLLRHPKVKVFITQGGLQSTEEAITAGVPLIGMPMLADQWYNVEMYVKHKIGLRLDMGDVTEENFKSYINEVIDNKSYRQNIVRLRDQIYDQPQSSLERAVWWTEHVLRHGGGKHLRAGGALKTWTEYYEVHFIATIVGGLAVILAVLLILVYYFFRVVSSFSATLKIKTS